MIVVQIKIDITKRVCLWELVEFLDVFGVAIYKLNVWLTITDVADTLGHHSWVKQGDL